MQLRKGILIILDGLGDRPVPALGGQTPLEAAATPHLDAVAAAGLGGFVFPLVPWVPVGTQTGTALLMGLARDDVRRLSRGPIEAAGVGLDVAEGDVALRCNFATLAHNGAGFDILDRRAGRIHEHTDTLAAALDGLRLGGITARVRAATQHRAVLVLSGETLSDAVTDTDPGSGREDEGLLLCHPRCSDDEAARRTADAINAFVSRSHEILADHPVNAARVAQGLPAANALITRGAGRYVPLRNLVAYLGVRAALVAAESTLIGLARLFGFSAVHRPTFTADEHTDLGGKVAAARTALADHDLVFLHIKGTDTCAHDGEPEAKRDFIERVDAALAPLLEDETLAVAVTGDHSTVTLVGAHTGDPVPSCLRAPGCRQDAVQRFGEAGCLRGGLGHLSATAFLCALLDHMGHLRNYQPHEHIFYL